MATVPIYDAMGNVTGFQETENPETDLTGNVTPLQLDYYRNKVREFQEVLNNMDAAAAVARQTIDEEISPDVTAAMQDALAEYDAKKWQFKSAAEALNFAINGVNAVGGNFPNLTLPSGLAAVPLVAGAAIAGALAVAAALVVWGRDWIAGVNDRLKTEQVLGAVTDPDKRAALAEAIVKTDAAQRASEVSPLTNIATMVKWVAIAAVGYFALQAYQRSR